MLVAAIIMRARLQRKRLIRCRVGHQAAATRVIHSYAGAQPYSATFRSHATAVRDTAARAQSFRP